MCLDLCRNPIFSTRRGDRAQQRPPELPRFLHFCDISRLRQEVFLLGNATGSAVTSWLPRLHGGIGGTCTACLP